MVKPGLTVLQVIPELSAGGAERTTLEMAEAVIRVGGRALVASEGGRLEGELVSLGAELFRLPMKTKSPVKIWQNRSALIDIITTEDVNIVHARSRAPAWSALWAARATQTPFVTTYHGAYGGTSAPKLLYNSVMARGDLVIANSNYIADHVRRTHKTPANRLVTIPRGVDTRRFAPDAIDPVKFQTLRESLLGDRRFLFVLPGRLTEWKGQMVFIEALGLLPTELREQISAVLVGDAQGRTAYVDSLKSAIRRHGLDDLVKITGHNDDMPTLYAASDLILAPSSRPEAFGRIAIEAQVMGKPVIASDHGGQRETVANGETGWLVEPGSAGSLAEAISDYLSQSETDHDMMGQRARQNVLEHYTTEALQRQTLEVYERLMSRAEEKVS